MSQESEKKEKNVHINGDRNAFLTKNAVDRFKNDIKKAALKEQSAYFKEGWRFEYMNDENDNNIHIKLIKDEKDEKEKKNEKVNKNKVLLQVRLSDLANQRKNENQLKHHLQKQKKSDGKKVPEELIEAYLSAKKVTRNPVIDPTLVCDNLDGYWQHVNGTAQGCGNSSNPFASYYRMLQNYIVTEKAKLNASA